MQSRADGVHLSGYRVAMDIGGTFTDFVVVDEDEHGETSSGKVLDDAGEPGGGRARGSASVRARADAGSTFIVHGTTVGLNAFLERKGTRVLLVMTDGPPRRVLDRPA